MPGRLPCAVAFVLLLAATGAATLRAQNAPPRDFEDLRQSVPQAQADGVRQIRLRWLTGTPSADPAQTTNTFELRSAESLPGTLRRDRAPQLSTTTLVVVSLDGSGRELDWRTVADPRIVRSEAPTNTAELTGERLYYLEADLLLQIPDLPDTTHLGLYSMRRQNGRVVLDALGTVRVR